MARTINCIELLTHVIQTHLKQTKHKTIGNPQRVQQTLAGKKKLQCGKYSAVNEAIFNAGSI